MKRRKFLHLSGASVAAFPLTNSIAYAKSLNYLNNFPDVVVVGAGVFGVWTAYHLNHLGVKVTLLDAYGPGNSRASSGGEHKVDTG